MPNSFRDKLDIINEAVNSGQDYESLEELDEILHNKEINLEEIIKSKLIQARIFFYLGVS